MQSLVVSQLPGAHICGFVLEDKGSCEQGEMLNGFYYILYQFDWLGVEHVCIYSSGV